MNEYGIKAVSELCQGYAGTEWQYTGTDTNLRGRIWKFDDLYPDNRRGCYMLRFSASKGNISNDGVIVRILISVPFDTFKRYFSPYRRQNIVAEEKPRNENSADGKADSNPSIHKKRCVRCVMTNKEIEDEVELEKNRWEEIELEKNGWTEKEIQNEINKNRKKCSYGKCHGKKLTDDELFATLLYNLYNLGSFLR